MDKLTDVQLRNWIKAGKPVAIADGGGLTFTLSAKGTAAWTLRYRIAGKRNEITLGRYPDISLAKAREIAAARRAEVQQGIDPAAEKRKAEHAAANAWTFARLAEDYLQKAGARLAPATMKQRRQQLRDYINPKIGPLRAAEVSPADVVGIAETLSRKSLHVARLSLITLREVFAHGVARHVVTANPCAHVKAKAVIGGRPDQRERVMLKDAEIAEMLPALAGIGKQNDLTVRILLATAARIGELTRAEWRHVDFERAEWRIPPELSKTRKPFTIPLAPAVAGWLAELKALAFGSRYVLPIRCPRGEKTDRPMEPTTLNAALNQLAEKLEGRCRRFTPHDLRATCRSHLGALGVDVLIAERCLNHSLGGLVAVYDKHDYLSERRRALELWAAKLAAIEAGAGFNIVPLKRA